MSNHLKLVCKELDCTRILLADNNKMLGKIIEWLEVEIEFTEHFMNACEDQIMIGRHKCAKSLLNKIKKMDDGDYSDE